MSIRRTAMLALSAAALGLATAAQTAPASAAVHPMTFDACHANTDSGVYNCMYIDGAGLEATEIRGWSTDFEHYIGLPVHEEVTAPNGTICNSDTVTITSSTQVVGCQLQPGGSFPIAAGSYCAISWVYLGYYAELAKNCGTAFS
jgi:hypothetical protein